MNYQLHSHCIFAIFSLKEPKVKEKGFGRWYADYASKATPGTGVYRHLPKVQAFIQLAGKLCMHSSENVPFYCPSNVNVICISSINSLRMNLFPM
jgi:hypothetical protein